LTLDIGLRLSHFTWPWLANNAWGAFSESFSTWPGVPSTVIPGSKSPCNGLIYPPGTNPCTALGVGGGSDAANQSLEVQKAILFQPRFGFAYDINGDGKSAIRGGVGLFYNRAQANPVLSTPNNPPYNALASFPRLLGSTTDALTGQPASASYGSASLGFDPNASGAPPNNLNWNVSYSRELVKNTTLQLAYVGSWGMDALAGFDANMVSSANRLAFALSNNAALKPLDGIANISNGNVGITTYTGNTIYHGLQTQLTSRFGHGSQVQVNYTYSKNIGNTDITDSGNANQGFQYVDNSVGAALNRGVEQNSRTHVFNANLVWALPTLEGSSSFVKNVFGDWEVTSIVTVASGYPINVSLGPVSGIPGGLAGTGGSTVYTFPDVVPGQSCLANSANPLQWLNSAAFTINGHAIGTNGDGGYDTCVGPGWFEWDLAAYKTIRLGPRAKLQLRVEGFNITNRNNFLVGGGNVSINTVNNTWSPQNVVISGNTVVSATPNTNFGQFSQVGPERQIQIGARLTF
jgi:hypothetical protein